MEQELLQILDQTLQPAEEPRRAAEAQLETLYGNDSFPIALVNIAGAEQAPLTSRQAALTTLKRYVYRCWSATFEEWQGPQTSLDVKNHLKSQLLGLVTSNFRQVRSIAAAVVGKIATSDYPDEWPELLPSLLRLVSEGNDVQTTGALHVLNDVVDEGLGDELFFQLAKEIVELLFKVATAEQRTFPVRALAVSTFKSCVDTLGMLAGGHEDEVSAFAQQALDLWVPFIIQVLEAPLPVDEEGVKGLMTLKVQSIKTVMQARIHFAHIFAQNIDKLFGATWSDINRLKDPYVVQFIQSDAEGRLVNSEGLPYSLDLYVLEQLDFIQQCLGNKDVREQIERAGFAGLGASPFSQMIYTTVVLSQISGEDRSMWEIDLNVFLSEETAVSANYTPRTACGDLARKLFGCFPERTLEALYDHTGQIFQATGDTSSLKEAALYLWDQLLHEAADSDLPIDAGLANGLLQLIVVAMTDASDSFLRARGYACAATLTEAAYSSITGRVTELMEQSIRASSTDKSEVVQICALRAFQKYCHSVAGEQLQPYQAGIIAASKTFLEHKSDDDPEDSQDVLAELVETVQAAASINHAAVLDASFQLPELLFTIANNGMNNYHIHGLVRDTFESLIRGLQPQYIPLCEKLLPMLTHMLELQDGKNDHPLMDLATEILSDLIEHGSSPLPQGLVATVMPHITRVLTSSVESEVVSAGCAALTQILRLDHLQLLTYRDPSTQLTGLEITLRIIDRLLSPEIPEATAGEVGGLAAELVEKVADQLGPELLRSLLSIVATRLANASFPPFVQSLILVFARLVLKQARDVVDFLSGITIENRNGLEVVISAWLAHTTIFTGYEDINQNVLALCHLYNLQDPRLANIMVQGDLIIPENSRIMTRSRAKANPDRYTTVSVPLKIVKLLVQELGPNVAEAQQRLLAKQAAEQGGVIQVPDDEEGEEEWEDEPEGLNIPGMSREELLALGASGRTSRQADDETYAVLVSFFKEVSANNTGGFHDLYQQLSEDEKHTLAQIR